MLDIFRPCRSTTSLGGAEAAIRTQLKQVPTEAVRNREPASSYFQTGRRDSVGRIEFQSVRKIHRAPKRPMDY